MDRRFEDVETDSTVDNTLEQMDTSDPEIQFRALAHGIDAGQLLAGDIGPVAVGPQTDVDARQAADPNTLGHVITRLMPRHDRAATAPSAAAEANGVWRGTAHSTPYSAEVMHYGPHHAASGAAVVDQSAVVGSELGCFVGPSLSRSVVERVVTSNWGETTPTTTGARTNTTATLTSTYVTCSTVGGPVQSAYHGGPPPAGLMAIRPARPFGMPHLVGQPERFPEALAGPRGILRLSAGNVQSIWGEASTRSMLRPGFDASYSVSRSTDRAADPGASGERYLDHGLAGDSVLVNVNGIHSPRSHGAGLNGTLEARQVDSAGAGTSSTGMRLVAGAYVQGPGPLGVPGSLPLPCPSTNAQTIQASGRDVQSPVCTSVQSPDMQGDQGVDAQWVHNASDASGLSSLPPTPDGGATRLHR